MMGLKSYKGGQMAGKKRIVAISAKSRDTSRMNYFRSHIGKKIITKSGDTFGRVFDIAFSGNTVTGIIVGRRLSKLFVGKEFVSSISSGSIMLSIDPVVMLVGKQVFDADGKKIGKVVKLVRKGSSNSFSAIIVKRKIYSKGIKVPASDIEVSKKNIILKKKYE